MSQVRKAAEKKVELEAVEVEDSWVTVEDFAEKV